MKEELKVGDPVLVIDQGLLMLQKFAPKNSFPNNYGRISEILEKDLSKTVPEICTKNNIPV